MKPSQAGKIARVLGGMTAVALILTAVLATCWLLYRREATQISGRQADLEVVRVNLLVQLLRGELRPVIDDLRLLADGDGLRTFLETHQDSALEAATRRAAFISVEKPLYDQVRYLDETGHEVFRVNQRGHIVAGSQLQNKADRSYFKEASALPPGTLFVSSFDLNVEGYQQANPVTPTLRFAVPVFDAVGRRRGIYIINCHGESLIASLQKAAAGLFKRVRLLNTGGYWLMGSDPGQEWGFALPEHSAFTLARTNPALWAQMQRNPAGQSTDGGGLITWQRILPVDFTGLPAASIHAGDAFLIVASAISPAEWDTLFAGLRQIMLITAVALAVLLLLSAWLFRGRLQAVRNLRSLNEELESRVQTRTHELAHSNELLQHREQRLQAQLQRLHMLEHITRAVGERQDLASILQVVVRTLEEDMPLDFSCVCLYEPTERTLTIIAVGLNSAALAERLAMTEQARIPIDENGLSQCVRGKLVYEPQIDGLPHPFPQRLAGVGLQALVAAPLQIESQVFGVLISARRQPNSFASGECEFLRQLSEHVALAAHQAQLHGALQTAYEELRNTQQAVMQQERLRVLGQMASGIAHDINNAISPITLYTDSMLDKETGLSERGRDNLRIIQQAAGDVAATVARMREFYRQPDVQIELVAVDINELVAQVIELTRARWEAMPQQRGIVIDLRAELAPRMPPIMGIKSEIREALTNLVFNAVDSMPQGGTLTLRTRIDDRVRLLVEVADTGVGMDEVTRRRCLEPFFTTKGERGTGLGLAMVYGTVQRHGGDLEIDSQPGSGTTVRLAFAAATEASPAATVVHAAPAVGLTILLVDDDPILLRSLRETLELDGHTILTASGGAQGIELFRGSMSPEGRTAVSVVITDLGMPHVDGRNVARSVKQASPDTPVILLTGWGERLLAEGDAPPYVDRVLSKPPRLRDVRQTLAELTASASSVKRRAQ